MQIGQKIIRLDSVDSTNNYIANLIKADGLVSGSVIMADEQFAGKGQRGAEWTAQPGENLTFSFFIDAVNLSVENQFVLTQLVSVALIDLLAKLNVHAEIKWPNDIYVNSKKIAGVLIENQLSGSFVKSTIIGIGLNVNQENFGDLNATSIHLETSKRNVPMEALFSFIECFNSIQIGEVENRYLSNLYQKQVNRKYKDVGGEFFGEIQGVNKYGKLVLLRGNRLQEYDLKEIEFL